jgi:uncharacterized protein YjbI with pentapeptide repeats
MNEIEQNIEGKGFKSEVFSKKSLERCSFTSCSFHSCDFSEAVLRNAKFCSCTFSNCNFSLVKLVRISHTFSKQIAALLTEIAVQMGEDSVRATRPHPSEQQDRHAECASCQRKCEKSGLDGCRLQDVQFLDCKIVGAEFFKCEKTFFSVNFKNCLMQYCNFSDLNMKNSSFHDSSLKESHFTNTILKGADFSGVDLLGTIFHNCDLCNVDFSSSTQYSIDPTTNKIKKAKFSFPEAAGLLRAFDITVV